MQASLVEGREPKDGMYLCDSLHRVGYFHEMDSDSHDFAKRYLVQAIGTLPTCQSGL